LKPENIRKKNLPIKNSNLRLRLKQLRVFGTIQNVFTLTDYSGIDPTAGVTGIDRNIYPQSRTFMTGFTVGF